MSERHTRKLRKLSISKAHIASLSADHVAVLASFSYCISEVNALWRVYDACIYKKTGNQHLELAVSIQKNTILRVWSAKLFEFSEGLGKIKGDTKLTAFLNAVRADLEAPTGFPKGDSLAGRFRHESTFHLYVDDLKKRLKFTTADASTDFYFDEGHANSFFPFGEEVVFAASFNRYVGNSMNEESIEFIRLWGEWVVSASKKIIYIFEDFLNKFVFSDDNPPNWTFLEIDLDPGMIASPQSAKVPLFLADDVSK